MQRSVYDEVVASRAYTTVLSEYIGREVAQMTAYETVKVILDVIGLLISLGMLTIALLNLLDKRKHSDK